jgi:hypothetical protein
LGGRDLSDGFATPPSSPLQRAPRNKREYENILLENTSTQSSRTSSRKWPRGTTSKSPGSSTILSGRRLREEENHHEGWKMEEDIKKRQKTYLLVPELESSPGSSVPASRKLSDTFAATSTSSSGAAAAPPTPRGRSKWAGGTGTQGSKRNIDPQFIDALHAQNCQTTAAYNCAQILAQILNFGGRKTTALKNTEQADQWEERRPSNRNTDASLASNIVPKADATPKGVAMPADNNTADANHPTIAGRGHLIRYNFVKL